MALYEPPHQDLRCLQIQLFGLKLFISENNIHGNYNIVIYINIIGLERKQYSLFGSSPKLFLFLVLKELRIRSISNLKSF